MKKITLVAIALPAITFAFNGNQKILDIGVSSGFYRYKEPQVMHMKGISYAVHGGVQYTFDNRLYLSVKGMYEFVPNLKYKSNNPEDPTADSEKSYIFDVSPRVGYSFIYGNDIKLSVYAGYGYEHLRHKAILSRKTPLGDLIKTTRRWQEYHYGLIGVNFIKRLDNNWLIDSSVDLNYMFHGKHKTSIEYNRGAGNISLRLKQKAGLGIKADLMTGQDYEYLGWRIGLYLRGWTIEQSSATQLGTVEPKNTTYDAGVKLKLTF